MNRNTILYIINVLLIASSIIVAVTGIIKFPGLLPALNINPYRLPQGYLTILHDWFGLGITILVLLHIVLHWKWINSMTGKMWNQNRSVMIGLLLFFPMMILLIFLLNLEQPIFLESRGREGIPDDSEEIPQFETVSPLDNTKPTAVNRIDIQGIGNFTFDPGEIKTVREDIFQAGYFSLFDILVHLDERDEINLDFEYHPEMETHVINSINGMENWWYMAYYDGGWPEKNVWRMDLYPYKDGSVIRVFQEEEEILQSIYAGFNQEVERRKANNGEIVIPSVRINLRTSQLEFNNVEVSAHDLRSDYFRQGTATAIDVILSLSETGEITHELTWYESIGSAGIVKDFFVEAINEDRAIGRCGFVYEVGSEKFYAFRGNHIHIPSDMRVLTSPEYVQFFWICL